MVILTKVLPPLTHNMAEMTQSATYDDDMARSVLYDDSSVNTAQSTHLQWQHSQNGLKCSYDDNAINITQITTLWKQHDWHGLKRSYTKTV